MFCLEKNVVKKKSPYKKTFTYCRFHVVIQHNSQSYKKNYGRKAHIFIERYFIYT